MNILRKLAFAIVALGGASVAQADLIIRGAGLIYDTELDVLWLQDANYAKSTGYAVEGEMTWAESMEWASNLEYYDSIRDVTYDDWRLPSSSQISGYNQTEAQLVALFATMFGVMIIVGLIIFFGFVGLVIVIYIFRSEDFLSACFGFMALRGVISIIGVLIAQLFEMLNDN